MDRPNRILVKLECGEVRAVYAERSAEVLVFVVDEKDKTQVWSQNRIELLANWKEDTAGGSQCVWAWDWRDGAYGEI